MKTYGTKVTLGDLFDFLYELAEEEIENKEYKDPHPSCSHYSSLQEMEKDTFCPKCGVKNHIVSHPKTLRYTYYRKTQFNTFSGKTSDDKKELMAEMVTKIYHSGGYGFRRHLTIQDGDEEIEIGITATGNDYSKSFLWFCDDYDGMEGPGCYYGLTEMLQRDLTDYNVYLVCFELDETKITSEKLKKALDKVRLFERLGFSVGELDIEEFSHPY